MPLIEYFSIPYAALSYGMPCEDSYVYKTMEYVLLCTLHRKQAVNKHIMHWLTIDHSHKQSSNCYKEELQYLKVVELLANEGLPALEC